ncbi:MAG: anti-sigma B factor antagonist [Chitinophagales bacterium]|jgi:anti-sigma B factor antagonist
MEINRVIENKITILELSGNLLGEKDASPILEAVGISLENDSNQFVIDLSGMNYINSTGLSVLLNILTKSKNAGGGMVIVSIPEQLSNLLTITKLTDVFPQADTKEEAIASL